MKYLVYIYQISPVHKHDSTTTTTNTTTAMCILHTPMRTATFYNFDLV
jgi:hypothetical protein